MDDRVLVGSKEEEVVPRLTLEARLRPIILFENGVVKLGPDGMERTHMELDTQLSRNAGDVEQTGRIKAEQRIEQGQ